MYIPALAATKGDTPLDCLEISSGSGQHVTFFAQLFPQTKWQPSEFDPTVFGSIRIYAEEAGVTNVLAPVPIDASKPEQWPLDGRKFDIVYNANLIHISTTACTPGLFKGSGAVLRPGGILFTYGPYAQGGIITPESNQRFDAMLRQQNPEWGLRDIEEVKKIASGFGLNLETIHDMPANNKTLVWRKQMS